jgi:hypothetical protein
MKYDDSKLERLQKDYEKEHNTTIRFFIGLLAVVTIVILFGAVLSDEAERNHELQMKKLELESRQTHAVEYSE